MFDPLTFDWPFLHAQTYIPVVAQRHEEDSDTGKENSYPDYISDEEEEVDKDKALAVKCDEENGGFLGSATRFFKNSFYW